MGSVVHRWQPTQHTLCGLRMGGGIRVNIGKMLSEGVTCKNCRRVNMPMVELQPAGKE